MAWSARYRRIDSGMSLQSSPLSMLFLAMFFIFARLDDVSFVRVSAHWVDGAYLFWNQICTERSVMLISCAIRSRTIAVGVGFLLNSISRVNSCSWVARWRFWFFCCWVKVLLRGGRREDDAEPLGWPVGPDAEGDGVELEVMLDCCGVVDCIRDGVAGAPGGGRIGVMTRAMEPQGSDGL